MLLVLFVVGGLSDGEGLGCAECVFGVVEVAADCVVESEVFEE